MNPYEKCPVYENKDYLLRLIDTADAPDLLSVYSDEKALPFFNSDNCNGDDFHYTSLEHMQCAINFWIKEYQNKGFVRWTIIDRNIRLAIGTIELFNRRSNDYFNNCGILRLDLRSDYEYSENILEILSLILQPAFTLFDCEMIATKVPHLAFERKKAIEKLNFMASDEKLIGGHNCKTYMDYYTLHK